METIYLQDKNYNWESFGYNDIAESEKELKKRKISIGDSATIGFSAKIGDSAKIGNYATIIKSFFIMGTKYSCTYVGNNKLSIGRHTLTIQEWLKNGNEIAEKEGFSEYDKREYEVYIKLARTFHNKFYKNETIK